MRPSAAHDGRRLLLAAVLLHLVVTALVFTVGRMQLAPHLLDRDGILRFTDSPWYQAEAVRLVDTLREHGAAAWARQPARTHVRLLSVAFALLAPRLGYGILAAEPVNLLCYLATIAVVFATAQELGGRRAAIAAAGMVALWPTFLLHTAQLLKDPLFICAALALVLVVVTWLTRTYRPRDAVCAGAAFALATWLLLSIREKFFPVIAALVLIGVVLLVARQLGERRVLPWNSVSALAIAIGGGTVFVHAALPIEAVKAHPSSRSGQPKSVAGIGSPRPGSIVWRPVSSDLAAPASDAGAPMRMADRAAVALGSVRHRYNIANVGAGSGIDGMVDLRSGTDVVLYLPRAAQIGLWAPFPNTWSTTGSYVGTAGYVLAGVETSMIYLCQALALVAVALRPRRLPALLLLGIAAAGMTTMGLVVSNVGTLYRFRYTFWMLLVILGATGYEKIAARRRTAGRPAP